MAEARLRNADSALKIKPGIMMTSQEHISLLDLPIELRCMIFSFYFQLEDSCLLKVGQKKLTSKDFKGPWYNMALPVTPSLLLVNRQVSREALAIRQKETPLVIDMQRIPQKLFPERTSSRIKTHHDAVCQSAVTKVTGYRHLTIYADPGSRRRGYGNFVLFQRFLTALDKRIETSVQPLKTLRIIVGDEFPRRRFEIWNPSLDRMSRDSAVAWRHFYELLMQKRPALKHARFGQRPDCGLQSVDDVMWSSQADFLPEIMDVYKYCLQRSVQNW